MSPRVKRAVGSTAIIVWLIAWIAGAAAVGDMITDAPPIVHLLYFPVAGVAWTAPLYPVFRWMAR